MLQPVVRRTWAPRGETPVLDCWDRHDRLSVISALTVSPERRRLGLYFDIFDHNIVAEDFEQFIAWVLQRIGRPITLVMDRWPVHKAAARRLQKRFGRRVRIEWLPAYAPELNVLRLGRSVADSLRQKRSNQPLLKSFFQHAKLRI